jgi:hypothetical protein
MESGIFGAAETDRYHCGGNITRFEFTSEPGGVKANAHLYNPNPTGQKDIDVRWSSEVFSRIKYTVRAWTN